MSKQELFHTKFLGYSLKLLFLGWFLAGQAQAGGLSAGGGGKGVVCRDSNGNINKPVELLDLWEAREIHHLQIIVPTESVDIELTKALSRWNPVSDIPTSPHNHVFQQKPVGERDDLPLATAIIGLSKHSRVQVYSGVKLELTDDSLEDMTPSIESGCSIEQIVRRVKSSSGWLWQVNSDLRDKMANADLIGLALHETIYDSLMTTKRADEPPAETNSLRVRRIVGQIMSGYTFKPTYHHLTKPFIHCSNDFLDHKLRKLFEKNYIESLDWNARVAFYFDLKFAFISSADVFFYQDPQFQFPKVKGLVDRMRDRHFVELSGPMIAENISTGTDLKTFYKRLKKGNNKMTFQSGSYSDVEFNTKADFSMNDGKGKLEVLTSTGGNLPEPVDGMNCKLYE